MADNDKRLLEELRQLGALEAKASSVPAENKRVTPVGSADLLLEGLTFGFGNKAVDLATAAVGAPFSDRTFSELYRDIEGARKRGTKKYEQESPVGATASRVTGALASAPAITATAPIKALGSLAGRFGFPGAIGAGAIGGETAERLYEAGTAPLGQETDILTRKGVGLGGVLGGGLPVVGAGVRGVKSALAPSIEKGSEEIINLAKKYDIPLGLDDLTDSKFYKQLIQKGGQLPFSGAKASAENQLNKFTKAISKSIGLDDASKLTPENMDRAFSNVGKQFDNLTKGKSFEFADSALDTLGDLDDAVKSGVYGEQGQRLFGKHLSEILSSVNDNSLSGERLSTLRAKFNKLSRTGTNVDAKTLAKDFENVLIDLIGEDAPDALRKAKYQYKNLIAVEPLAQKAQVDGFISPALLTSRVRSVYGRQFTRGKAGELGDLARIGQAIKQDVPDSGTPIGNFIVGGLSGGSVPLAFISPTAATLQAGAGGLGMLANRALQSRNVNPAKFTKQSLPVPATRPIQTGVQAGALSGMLQQ